MKGTLTSKRKKNDLRSTGDRDLPEIPAGDNDIYRNFWDKLDLNSQGYLRLHSYLHLPYGLCF